MKTTTKINAALTVQAEDVPGGVRLSAKFLGIEKGALVVPEEVFAALVVNASTLAEHIERKRDGQRAAA